METLRWSPRHNENTVPVSLPCLFLPSLPLFKMIKLLRNEEWSINVGLHSQPEISTCFSETSGSFPNYIRAFRLFFSPHYPLNGPTLMVSLMLSQNLYLKQLHRESPVSSVSNILFAFVSENFVATTTVLSLRLTIDEHQNRKLQHFQFVFQQKQAAVECEKSVGLLVSFFRTR